MALKVGELFATLNLDQGPFTKGLGKVGSLFGKGMKGMATASAAMAAAAAAAGAAAMKSIVNTGMSFEAAMSDVQAISGASGDELKLLTDTAKKYGATTSFTATESAEALKYMALAGWDAKQSAAALPGVLNLAAASGMALGTASDYVTDYISAFGMECSQSTYLADLMAKAQSTSNTSAQQLGEAYKNCAANLHAAGQDVETTTSMLMVMADQGLKGSEAGTALAAVMRDITAKMDEGAIKIGDTAVAVQDAHGNFRDLTDILADVQTATEGMGTAEKSAALMSTFTARSLKGINLMLNAGADAAANYETSLRGATGTASEQAGIMLNNLQGDIKLFQSALEGLQIDAYDSMNGMMRETVQGATSVVSEMQNAFQHGMSPTALEGVIESAFDLLGNMGDTATDLILNITDAFSLAAPKLAKGLTSGLGDAIGKVSKKMPKIAKNLFSALPDALGAAGNLIPALSDSLSETLFVVFEQVTSDLPELMPILGKGIGDLFKGAFKNFSSIMDGIATGIWNILGETGRRSLTIEEVIQEQLDNVDTDKVNKIIDGGLLTYTFDVTIDPGEYQEKIDAAVLEIHNALLHIPDLSESDRTAIEEAILAGSGADALAAALAALEIPDASGVAQQITTSLNTISTALSSTDLPAAAQAKALEIAAAGGDVEQALIDMGVDPSVAGPVAEKITGACAQIDSAVSGLGIDPSVIATLKTNATTDKGRIVAALQMLGISDADLTTIIQSYDTAAGTLSAQFQGVFDSIGDALTNGIPDDPERDPDFAEAKRKLAQYITAAHEKLKLWRDQKLKELEDSGLTGDALSSAIQEVETKYNELSTSINETGAQTAQWIDDNAGKATSAVQANLGQLEDLANRAHNVSAVIDALGAQLTTGSNLNRKAVEQGLVSDQSGQNEAINYTYQELQYALEQANQKSAAALEQAQTEFAGDTKGYAAERERIMGELAEAQGAAYETYNQHMARILAGVVGSDPKLAEQLGKYNDDVRLKGEAKKLLSSVNTAWKEAQQAARNGEQFDLSSFWSNLKVSNTDFNAIAESLGIEPYKLQAAINEQLTNALSNPEFGLHGAGSAGSKLSLFAASMYDGLAAALESGEVDISGLSELLVAALDEGLLTDTDNKKWSTDLTSTILGVLTSLEFDENGNVIIPPLTVAPEPTVQEGTGEKISETVEEATKTTDGSTTVEPEIVVDPEVTPAEGTSEQIAEEVEKSTKGTGETTTVKPEVTIKPDAKPAEGAQQEVSDAIDAVTGEEAPPIDMTMDVNASVGNVTFAEGGSIADKLMALFTETTVPLAFSVSASVSSLSLAEDYDLNQSVTDLMNQQLNSVSVSAAATVDFTNDSASIQAACDALISAATASLSGMATAGIPAGRNFSAGIASGINAGRSGVISAAISVANAAAAAARSALQIHSPSRVTQEMGALFDMGFAKGISSSMRPSIRAASDLANMAANAATVRRITPNAGFVHSARKDSSSTLSIDYDALADAMNQRQMALYMNRKRVAEVMTEDIGRSQANYNRKITMGYGGR